VRSIGFAVARPGAVRVASMWGLCRLARHPEVRAYAATDHASPEEVSRDGLVDRS
jgi:hypothetical protein